jgi:hypothetical protein
MRKGLMSANTHAIVEPFMAVVIIASPWIFGFSDVSEAKSVAIAVGVIMLLSGAMTQWRYSVAKIIPLPAHFATDVVLGAFLILSPFIFGFSDEGGPTRWAIIVGVLELGAALGTRWDPDEVEPRVHNTARA